MNKINIKEIVEDLIDTFLYAGKVSLDLRHKGLTKKIKSSPKIKLRNQKKKLVVKKVLSQHDTVIGKKRELLQIFKKQLICNQI